MLECTTVYPAGNRVEGVPEDLASLWLSQSFAVSDTFNWRVGGGVRYVGDKIDFYQLQLTPSVTLYDVMAQANYKDWTFALNINNLTDEEFCAFVSAYAFPDGTCYPGLTRTIIGTIAKRF